eukprot:1564744-Pyramimonas_sp.AAC.1
MEQLYDPLDLGWLIDTGIALGFSPTVTALEVEAFLGPRHLTHADWITPSRSIVAGSAQGAKKKHTSVDVSPLLQAAQLRAQAAGLWTCVGNAVGSVEGAAEHAKEQMTQLADEILIQATKKRNLKISPETAPVASTPMLRR